MTGPRISLPVIRGSTEGARCYECPLSINGMPGKPVVGIGPEDPAWIVLGEGPGCFPAGTPIRTPDGFKPIETVSSGEFVVGGDGSATHVSNTFRKPYDGTLIRIQTVGGFSVEMTAKHPVFVHRLIRPNGRGHSRRTIGQGEWLPAEHVTSDHALFFPWSPSEGSPQMLDLSGYKTHVLSKPVPSQIPLTPEVAFLLGMYMGDGGASCGVVTLFLSDGYKEKYVEVAAKILEGSFGVKPTIRRPALPDSKVICVRASATKLQRWFSSKFGIQDVKRVPIEIMRASPDVRSAFLFGWHETDGRHLSILTKPRDITTVSHRGALDAVALFLSLGVFPVFRAQDPYGKGKQVCYSIGINNDDVRKLGWNLPVHDQKTRRLHTIVDGGCVVPVSKVSCREWSGEVFNIETGSNDYAVPFKVHNSFETARGLPFIGPSGAVVDKAIAKIGVDRATLWVSNVTLCQPPSGSDVALRERAAEACKPRLVKELARFKGKPILTLGAVAARAVIPKEALDAIDPPDTPKAIKKAQKLRQEPTRKKALARRRSIDKEAKRKLEKMINHVRKSVITEHKVKYRQRPPEHVIQEAINRGYATMLLKSNEDAIKLVDGRIEERRLKAIYKAKNKTGKPKKKKPVKITDITGTLFDVDVDGSGIRPVIPAIHPAALLRGGGASIGGSHTPDMAFVNICFDAAKINSLSRGIDIRLKPDIAYELENQPRAIDLFLEFFDLAKAEGAFSLDLETYVHEPERHSALMAYIAQIRVIGLGTAQKTISLAWELLPSWCASLLQILFQTTCATFHNGLYDRTVLRAHGFDLQGDDWDDTLLAHHAAFPGNSHRLQVVGSQFFGVGPWKSEFRNSEETLDKLADYNAKDTAVTHALRKPLIDIWIKRTKTEQVYKLDKKMSDVASAMHLAGMPVDRDINDELLKTFSKNVAESRENVENIACDKKLRDQVWHHLAIVQARVQRKLDPPDFEARYQARLSAMRLDPDWKWKIGSSKHVAALLQAMGVGLIQRTAGGDLSTKKDVLEALVEVPIVRDILTFRENDKLHSTFVWALFDRFDPRSGEPLVLGYTDEFSRIHPIWNVHRITGRWASQWPVVSNVPKDKWLKLIAELLASTVGSYKLPERSLDKAQVVVLPSGAIVRVNKDGSISKQVRPNLRRQIRARPGRVLVGFDFEQVEARVIGLISGDPFLCEIFADPKGDVHTECSKIIWPHFMTLDPDTRYQLRENVKNIEYGYFYMAQIDTLHQTMLKAGNLIKKSDLAMAIAKLASQLTGIKKWQQESIVTATTPPYEAKDFILGRRRVWPLGQAEGGEAVNYGVQTAASALMNQGMARMFPKLAKYKQAWPIGQFHDAAVFECWECDGPSLAKDCDESFATVIERDGREVRFPIKTRIGISWDQV